MHADRRHGNPSGELASSWSRLCTGGILRKAQNQANEEEEGHSRKKEQQVQSTQAENSPTELPLGNSHPQSPAGRGEEAKRQEGKEAVPFIQADGGE